MHSIMHNLKHSTRVLNIPLIRCDDQVFNGVIKQELIADTDNNDDYQLSRFG